MKAILSFVFILCVFWAQAQRVDAAILDIESGEALAYCSVEINSIDDSFSSKFNADRNGAFDINLSQGEYILQFNYIGYEKKIDTISVIENTLNTFVFQLKQSSIIGVNPIITSNLIPESNTLLINKNNFLKLSGSFNDPSRLLLKFPGIAATNDQSNFISLSGMPPYMAGWFVNGASIVNPNHLSNTGTFTDQASANGGGVNMISGNSIGEFRFIKSPLNSNYFNVGSGLSDFTLDVDKGLRFSIGLLGTKLSYGFKSDEISVGVNYRYSTLGILSSLGVPLGDERITFQDVHTRIERKTEKYKLGLDVLIGNSSNIHDPLEDIVFLKDGLFIGLSARQEIVSGTYDVYGNKWQLNNTLNYSSRRSSRELMGVEDIIGFSVDSIEQVQETRISMNNRFNYFITNFWDFSFSNTYEIGQIRYRNQKANYRRAAVIASIKYQKDRWKIEGGIGLSGIGVRKLELSDFEDRLGSERRLLLQYQMNKSRWSGRVGSGLVSVQPEFMLIGTSIVPMLSNNISIDYMREGGWGKMKIGGYYHQFSDVLVSESGGVSYFSRFDLIEKEVLDGNYTTDGDATIMGLLLEYQKTYKAIQILANGSFYDLAISDNIEGDFAFNYTYSSTLSYSKKIRNNQFIVSTSFQGRGANREFEIDLEDSRNQSTTIYNRNLRIGLRPFSRLDFKVSYAWGKKRFNKERYVISLDILNLLNRQNDSYSFYDPIADDIILNTQLGLIPILKFDVNL